MPICKMLFFAIELLMLHETKRLDIAAFLLAPIALSLSAIGVDQAASGTTSNCHAALYNFFKDQGSSLSGLLALLAGIIAYMAGRRQALASEAETAFLVRSEKRQLARDQLLAVRIIQGLLRVNAERLQALKTQPGGVPQMRQSIREIPLLEVHDSLRLMSREFIDQYVDLVGRFEDLRSRSLLTTFAQLGSAVDDALLLLSAMKEEADRISSLCENSLAD